MKRFTVTLAAILLATALAACSSPASEEGEDSGPKSVIYVGGETIGDQLTVARLKELGFEVSEMTDRELSDEKAKNYSLVYINSTISSPGNIGTKLYNNAVPVIYAAPKVLSYNDMAGTGENTDYGKFIGRTVNVTNGEHPIAAGLSGNVDVYKNDGSIQFIVPGGDATIIATAADDEKKALITVYEKGAKNMIGNEVPARRVFFYLAPEDLIYHTDDGWKLFDAAVKWAVGDL
ncbi:hypothetical protein ABEV74_20095 [Paenibacillus cisolokensis]|uniref:hypothetical protein n=1 Tax=Paenibacillus cisolokensis TaxID=1658519 RepID=UPI003D272CA6